MSGRLIALDKNPGVRPIGICESWRRMFAKCLLAVAGKNAADECGIDNLSGGMSAGIEAAFHSANEVVDGNYETDDWGFILVDARNAFNELNAIRCFGRLDTYGLMAVDSHSIVTAIGSPFLSEDEPGHYSLSSQRQGSPRGVLFHATIWIG